MRLLSLLVLAACPDTTKTTTDTGTESPPPTDTAPTDSGTTDTGTTDTAPQTEPTDLTFLIDGDFAGTALVVASVDFYSGLTGAPLATTAVTASAQTLSTPEPPKDMLVPIDPDDPGTRVAFYAVGLLADTDGDEQPSSGEVYMGVSPATLLYIESDSGLTFYLSLLGLRLGWNAVEFGSTEYEPPTVYDLDMIPVTAPGTATTARLAGTYPGAEPRRLALLPVNQLESGTLSDVLYDEPLGAKWEIALDGAPPASHLVYDDPYVPAGSSFELPASFVDSDKSGSVTEKDTFADGVCTADGRGVWLAWVPPSDDLFFTLILEGRSGWIGLLDPEGATEITGPELTDLVVGPCTKTK